MSKRITSLVVSLLLFFILNINKVSAQWLPSGPEGGYIQCSTASGDSLYTVTGLSDLCSFHISYDRGNTWTNSTSPQFPSYVYAIFKTGNNLFAGGMGLQGVGLYRSDDEGQTWVLKKALESSVKGFAAYGNTIYATTSWDGILRSTDDGEHWVNVTNNLPDIYFEGGLLVTPTTVYVSIGDYNGVWRSTNLGITWEKASDGLDPFAIVLTMAAVGNEIYAGTDAFGLYKSSDEGQNWISLDPGTTMNYWDYQNLAGNSSVIFAASYRDGILRSTDQGNTWSTANNGMDIYDQPASLYETGGAFIVGTKGGMYRTTDQGENWSDANTGLYAQNSRNPLLVSIDTNLFTGSFNNGIFRSTDQGDHWDNVSDGLPVNLDNMQTYSAGVSTLFAYDKMSVDMGNTWIPTNSPGRIPIEHKGGLFAVNSIDGVYRSMDFGANWTNVTSTLFSNGYGSLEATDSILLLGTYEGAYYSEDNGDSWHQSVFQDALGPIAIVNLISNGTTQFCGLVNYGKRGIYRSTDNFATWTKVHDLLVTKIIISGSNIYASGNNLEYIEGDWIEIPSIFLSQDNGSHWTKISSGIEGQLFPLSIAAEGSKVFISMASAPDFDIYFSADKGANWVKASQGLPERTFVTFMSVSGNYVYAGTFGSSLWRRSLSAFELPAQPDAISGQANPCNGSSQIYSVTPVPDVTYTWQFPADWIITAGAGTHSVTVTVGTTAGIALVTPSTLMGNGPAQFLVVTPAVGPEAGVSVEANQQNVCSGTTVIFTATSTQGGASPSYQWLVNDIASGDSSSLFSFIPADNDKIKVLMTSSLECVSNNPATSNEITIQVKTLPDVSWTALEPDTMCRNWTPVLLSGAMPAGGVYSGEGVSNNTFDPSAVAAGSHIITYTYTDANSCSNQASIPMYVNVCEGIEETHAGWLVYPNPASEIINIRVPDSQGVTEVSLYNTMGLRVYENHDLKISGIVTIPVHNLPAGNYILKVTSHSETLVKPLIIK